MMSRMILNVGKVVAVLIFSTGMTFGQFWCDFSNEFVYVFPQVPVGGSYTFSIAAHNLTAQNTCVKITWYDSNGQRYGANYWPAPFTSTMFTGAIEHWANLTPWMGEQFTIGLDQQAVQNGWAKVEVMRTLAGQPSSSIYGTFKYRINGVVVGQASVLPVAPTTSGFSLWVKHITSANLDQSETGIAMVNYSNNFASVTLTLRDPTGGTILETATITLSGWAQRAAFLSDLFSSLGSDGLATLDITSSAPIAVVGLETTGWGATFNFSSMSAGPGRPVS